MILLVTKIVSQGTDYKSVYSHFFLTFWTNDVTNFLKVTWIISPLTCHLRFKFFIIETIKVKKKGLAMWSVPGIESHLWTRQESVAFRNFVIWVNLAWKPNCHIVSKYLFPDPLCWPRHREGLTKISCCNKWSAHHTSPIFPGNKKRWQDKEETKDALSQPKAESSKVFSTGKAEVYSSDGKQGLFLVP